MPVDVFDLANQLRGADLAKYPNFFDMEKPLDQGLWILLVVKSETDINRLSSEEISEISRLLHEVSIPNTSISQAFRKAGDMLHVHNEAVPTSYEIMKTGKDRIRSKLPADMVESLYIREGTEYTSKRLVVKQLIEETDGPLLVSDPYVGKRTLDILDSGAPEIRLLTRFDNLTSSKREKFLRWYKDYQKEHSHVLVGDYPHSHLHDRYVITDESLIIIGHSIKDLGGKESLALVLPHSLVSDLHSAISETFNRRWKEATVVRS